MKNSVGKRTRVADRYGSTPSTAVQLTPGKRTRVQARYGSASPQRSSSSAQIRRKSSGSGAASASPADAFSQATSGTASSLPHREKLEQSFGADLTSVSAHVGTPEAQTGLSTINAEAAAQGENVAFMDSAPALETVAHEVAHVVQARSSGANSSSNGAAMSSPGDKSETEADRAGRDAAAGKQVQVGGANDGKTVHRSVLGGIVGGAIGGVVGAVGGAIAGGLVGGIPGAIVGGIAGGALGATAGAAIGHAATGSRDPAPTIRQVAASLCEIAGTANDGDKQAVVTEMIKIPLGGLKSLKEKNTKVVVCRDSVTEVRTDLAGVRPRGWPPGKTWDSVPGLFDPGGNRVIIACRNGAVPPTGDGHGAANLVIHEVGHAIDSAVDGNNEPAFVTARTADAANLSAYESQAGEPGLEETYAESMARFYSNDPNDATRYPHLHAYWASSPLASHE